MERIDKQPEQTSRPDRGRRGNSSGRVVFALILIGLGTYWLLNRLGLIEFPHWLFQWPMILIGIGVINLIINRFQSIGGWILLLIGGYFYIDRNFDVPFELSYYFWPIALITIGIIVLVRPRPVSRPERWGRSRNVGSPTTVFDAKTGTDDSDTMNEQVVLGGVDKTFTSKNFKGGKISCAMGGAEIYMGDCAIQGSATLQINGFMSGISITVPRDWHVEIRTNTFLGGLSDERRNVSANPETAPRLILTGGIFMAGLEIKSV